MLKRVQHDMVQDKIPYDIERWIPGQARNERVRGRGVHPVTALRRDKLRTGLDSSRHASLAAKGSHVLRMTGDGPASFQWDCFVVNTPRNDGKTLR